MNEYALELAALAASFLALFAGTWARVAIVVAVVGFIAYRNRAKWAEFYTTAKALNSSPGGVVTDPEAKPVGFLSIAAVSLLAGLLGKLAGFGGFILSAAQTTGGVLSSAVGIIPEVLKALDRPIVAAMAFGLMGLAVGYSHGETAGGTAVKVEAVATANKRADRAIHDIRLEFQKGLNAATAKADAAEKRCPAPKAVSKK